MPRVPHTPHHLTRLALGKRTHNRHLAPCQGCWPTYGPLSCQREAQENTRTLKRVIILRNKTLLLLKYISIRITSDATFQTEPTGHCHKWIMELKPSWLKNWAISENYFYNAALISPLLLMMLLKMPLLTMWKANCVDGVPNMTSIKRFHNPGVTKQFNSSAPTEKALRPFVIINANILRKRFVFFLPHLNWQRRRLARVQFWNRLNHLLSHR